MLGYVKIGLVSFVSVILFWVSFGWVRLRWVRFCYVTLG